MTLRFWCSSLKLVFVISLVSECRDMATAYGGRGHTGECRDMLVSQGKCRGMLVSHW